MKIVIKTKEDAVNTLNILGVYSDDDELAELVQIKIDCTQALTTFLPFNSCILSDGGDTDGIWLENQTGEPCFVIRPSGVIYDYTTEETFYLD